MFQQKIMMAKRTFRVVLMAVFLFVWFLPVTGLSQSADHLLISQVQITGGKGFTKNDFIELYNPTDADIDLKGYRLVKRTKSGEVDSPIKSWSHSAIIPARGYFLWANSGYTDIPVAPDATTSAALAANNGIALRLGPANTGEIVDAVAWGEAENAFVEGTVFAQNPPAGFALRRKNNQDTDDNASDFELVSSSPRNSSSAPAEDVAPPKDNTPAQPAPPEAAPAPPPAAAPGVPAFDAGVLRINELLPNPSGRDSGNEWIEFYNFSSKPFDLSGWILDDKGEAIGTSAYYFPEHTLVLGFDYFTLTLPPGKFALNNSGGDCVRLFDPEKNLQTELCYEEPAREDQSYAYRTDSSYEWSPAPSPNEQNVFPKENKPPVVYGEIVINEVYPNPPDDEEEEFIELKNIGDEEVDLLGWRVGDRNRTYEIEEEDFIDTVISPGQFFVIPRTVSRIALNNSGGESIKLDSPAGTAVDEASYANSAKEGLVYARTEAGDFLWSKTATPGSENVFSSEDSAVDKEIFETTAEDEQGEVAGAAARVASVSEAKKLADGTLVSVAGQVTAPPNILGANIIYIAGSGIRVRLAGALDFPTLALGDIASVTGTLATVRGEREIKVARALDLAIAGRAEPKAPLRIATGQVGEKLEGELVRLSGEVVETSGKTFFIDDGSGPAKIYIMDSTNITKPRTRRGDVAVVTGIVSQFDDTYRVLPRFQEDLEIGQVTAARSLPRTGVGYWLGVLLFCAAALIVFEILDFLVVYCRKGGFKN